MVLVFILFCITFLFEIDRAIYKQDERDDATETLLPPKGSFKSNGRPYIRVVSMVTLPCQLS